MKIKRIIAYLLYLSGLLLLIFWGGKYLEELRILAGREFNPLPLILFSTVYSVFVGMYIALPKLVGTLMKNGKFRLDWLKVLIVGIPTLLITASGILYHYLSWDISFLAQWVYMQYNAMSVSFIGVVSGYTLLSSVTKDEITESISTGKNRIAKIVTLVIVGTFILYISFYGLIHPLKLVEVNADIATTDNQAGYLVNEGKETVYFIRTDINYTIKLDNMPYSRLAGLSDRDKKIWIEPKEKLQNLLGGDFFKRSGGIGFSGGGKQTELRLTYIIGSIDPLGNHPDQQPPSPEVLAEIKDALYDADLVIQVNDHKIERFNLSEYKEEGL